MFDRNKVIAGSIVVVVGYLFIAYIGIAGAKWADKISKQTEQNFADAIRTMQGTK